MVYTIQSVLHHVNTTPLHDPLAFQAAALQLRSHRQAVLASNLANADTPGYQARDIRFADALQARMQGGDPTRLSLAATNGRHLAAPEASDGPAALLYRSALQPSVDGNTVDPDVERAHFAENTAGFELATALLGRTVRSRQMALTGQP